MDFEYGYIRKGQKSSNMSDCWILVLLLTYDQCELEYFGQCVGYDYMAYMDDMDPNIRCPKKAVKLNHSLSPIWNQMDVTFYF